MTRDGLRLEQISIALTKVGHDVPGTDRTYQAGMLPHEIAELSLGLLEPREGTKNFSIETIEVVNVTGHDAYKAEATYVDEGGLPKRLQIVGIMSGEFVCELLYAAADLVCFQKYEPAFEEMLAGVRTLPR